jgi:ketosteroid isomerase-like protein
MRRIVVIVAVFTLWVSAAVARAGSQQTFSELELKISHAVETHDLKALNNLLADDYISIGVSGQVRSKADVLQAYSHGLTITNVRSKIEKVRVYGDMAIATGVITMSGKEGSVDISGNYAFTRVYQLRLSKWLAVSFQATPIR